MSKSIPINKGNYDYMETPERIRLFDLYRSEGWENEYLDYRMKWTSWPENKTVGEYPLNVDMELSTVCNLKCPMCYTIRDEFQKRVSSQFMCFDLFKKVIDEISGKVPALRLSLRGESTLHPDFIRCIQYAKKSGIKEVSTLTNGSMLSEDFFEKMLLAGIDWVTISIDGVGKTYEDIRKPLKFQETLDKIRNIKKIKDIYHTHRPVIKIQTIWPAIRDNPEEYYDIFAPYVDLIAYNPLVEYGYKIEGIRYIPHFSCSQIYQRLIVTSNGMVIPCCANPSGNIYVGDAYRESIYDIWHGEKLNYFRRMFDPPYEWKKINGCLQCLLPMVTDESEKAIIHGRQFTIKNYRRR